MNYRQNIFNNEYIDSINPLIGGFIRSNTINPLKPPPPEYDKYMNSEKSFLKELNKKQSLEDIKKILDYFMPIPNLYNDYKNNMILINDKNYVLINYKKDEDFDLLKLTDDFQIKKLEKPYPVIIEDNLLIEDMDSATKIHDMFESYYLFKTNFFIDFVKINSSNDESKYYFNTLKNILYKIDTKNDEIKYDDSTDNFWQKIIFMNILPDIIKILDKFDDSDQANFKIRDYEKKIIKFNESDPVSVKKDTYILTNKTGNTTDPTIPPPETMNRTGRIFKNNDFDKNKEENLYCIKFDTKEKLYGINIPSYEISYNYKDSFTGDFSKSDNTDNKLINFVLRCKEDTIIPDNVKDKFKDKHKAISILEYNIRTKLKDIVESEKDTILKIVSYIYDYVEENPNLIDSFNYACFINQYDYYFNRKNDKDLKPLNYLIKKDEDAIKQLLVFELVYNIYILYKTNNEFKSTSPSKISQYLLFDYFLGCSEKNKYLRFNVRQTLISIRNNGIDNNKSIDLQAIPAESKYKIFISSKPLFKYIKETKIDVNESISYTDCGERLILNTLNYFIMDDTGNFKIRDTWHVKLKDFYGLYNNINIITKEETLQDMKNKWGRVIENIPELFGLDFYLPEKKYNMQPSKDNFIKILKILLGLDFKTEYIIEQIFKILDPLINEDDIKIYKKNNYDCIEYKDILLELKSNHAEFKLLSLHDENKYLNEFKSSYNLTKVKSKIIVLANQSLKKQKFKDEINILFGKLVF